MDDNKTAVADVVDPPLIDPREIDVAAPVQSLMRLARKHGPVFRLDTGDKRALFVSSHDLVDEVCNEKRFDKRVHIDLKNIREYTGDGLFTARTEEPNWGIAHRILMPAFGPIAIHGMFDEMLDIAEQMVLRWDRFGPRAVIDVADDMTRLTLDTIALCAFSERFNSFYQNEMHPFVDAMVDALSESGARARRPDLIDYPLRRSYPDSLELMRKVADGLVEERRRDPEAASKKDLLGLMMAGRDPVTGEGLSDENIRYQLVTFLIAGHETTSGMLSFALYFLVKNPEVLQRARAEVDEVLGDEIPRFEHVGKLRYVEQALMETLRIWPTAPTFAVRSLDDTVIGGRYEVRARDAVFVMSTMLHRDPAVWGEDVEDFSPERFAHEVAEQRPINAWKPFGNGQRACIGRPFAMQEAKLVVALILQRFDLIEDDPSYQLEVKETLTLKPHNFRLRVERRGGPSRQWRSALPATPSKALAPAAVAVSAAGSQTPLLILYGSNTGSSEAFGQRLVSEAAAHGYAATLAPLDEHAGKLPTDRPVLFLASSYEGQPPDNARQFVAWLEGTPRPALEGLRYAVFGCGNRQWARTYQAVPKRIDEALAKAGATSVRPRGETDAGGDFFGGFDQWREALWLDLGKALGKAATAAVAAPRLEVELVRAGRSSVLRLNDLEQAQIVVNEELVDMSSPLGRSKRHIEIELPAGMTYQAGDYLSVLPRNPFGNVDRALRRFGYSADSHVIISRVEGVVTSLPVGYPVGAGELLANYVELGQPATRSQVQALAEVTRCPPEAAELSKLTDEETYIREVLGRRVSVLELLERFPSCELPFGDFLEMLPPMRARQYSIASSPLHDPKRCALTVAVVDAPALSGHGRYRGLASSLLAASIPGTRVAVSVRRSGAHFHPPSDPATPMIMVCAGTGLAPFRGFLQERAAQFAGGQKVAPSLLFFGCDHPDVDHLYRDLLAGWEASGIVSVRPTYFKAPQNGLTFVQHRLWQDRADVSALFRKGAHVFVCGDGKRMAPAVRETFVQIYQEAVGVTVEAAELWMDRIERDSGRYVADVFA